MLDAILIGCLVVAYLWLVVKLGQFCGFNDRE
jgi:hypothetical protein